MANIKIEVNYKNVGQLLKSDDMRNIVKSAAETIAHNAGQGYRYDAKVMGTRVIASAYAGSKKAKRDCLENNTLLKAAHL